MLKILKTSQKLIRFLAVIILIPISITACSLKLPDMGGAPPTMFHLNNAETNIIEPHQTSDARLIVEAPDSISGIDSTRIKLTTSPNAIDYFAGISWTESAPIMVQNLLISSLQNHGKFASVSKGRAGTQARYLLRTELRSFEAIFDGTPQTGDIPKIRITLHASLMDIQNRTIIESHLFSHEITAQGSGIENIIQGFDEANSEVIEDLILWLDNTVE